ncbi:MAG: molybdenum cofactor biosynthesis protein MoaE [Candidatus Carbobacillus altaicus]|nr:molybdenum cofactor biosynthesis protein MoaE [Candidatus Carbobacillus altaicus]
MFELTEKPIELQPCLDFVIRPEMGAVNVFLGTAREWTHGRKTVLLRYEAYVPMAEKMLVQIGEEVRAMAEGARIAVVHRLGEVAIGEAAVAIVVATPHRDGAYAGSRHIIERIKEMVPIWKKEQWEDGEAWIGDQGERVAYPEGKPPVDALSELSERTKEV